MYRGDYSLLKKYFIQNSIIFALIIIILVMLFSFAFFDFTKNRTINEKNIAICSNELLNCTNDN